MDIALVSHYEPPDVPRGDGYNELEKITKLFVEMGNATAQERNKTFKSTFCVGFHHNEGHAVIREIPGTVLLLGNIGNEIGVHTHVAEDNLADHVNYVASDRLELMLHGITVRSWTSGEWYHSGEDTFKALEAAGYTYDLSVLPIFKPFDIGDGKYTIDYTKCKQVIPYHPAPDNPCKKGTSEILEVPVLGLLDELRFGEGEFDPNIAVKGKLLDRILKYKEKYPEGIFQIVWHPFEFLIKGTADMDELFAIRVKTFLGALANEPNIRFTSVEGHFKGERIAAPASLLSDKNTETTDEKHKKESASK
ncbi:MAG: hypothetical protein GY771_10085 [bacterium]|nr:hypothetical protein [bacterium]